MNPVASCLRLELITKRDGLFKCQSCPKSFNKRGDYNRHCKTHARPYLCEKCEEGFGLRSNLIRHNTLRHSQIHAKFHCKWPKCRFSHLRSDRLKVHIWSSHATDDKDMAMRESTLAKLHEDALKEQKERSQSLSLIVALTRGDTAQVDLLLRNGADLDVRTDNGETALHMAVSKGNKEFIHALLDAGIDIDAKCKRGESAFYNAVDLGREGIVRVLLDGGASTKGALHRAVDENRVRVVEALLSVGVDLDAWNDRGEPALHQAVRSLYQSEEAVDCLLRHGADPDTMSWSGLSALHVAAEVGKVDIVELLISKGAGLGNKTPLGETALRIAKRHSHTEVVNLLQRYSTYTVDWKTGQRTYYSPPLHAESQA